MSSAVLHFKGPAPMIFLDPNNHTYEEMRDFFFDNNVNEPLEVVDRDHRRHTLDLSSLSLISELSDD